MEIPAARRKAQGCKEVPLLAFGKWLGENIGIWDG
jgi:hypothetical protein